MSSIQASEFSNAINICRWLQMWELLFVLFHNRLNDLSVMSTVTAPTQKTFDLGDKGKGSRKVDKSFPKLENELKRILRQ